MSTIPGEIHLNIGALIFPFMDRCDFTGPFEALSRFHLVPSDDVWRNKQHLCALVFASHTTEEYQLRLPNDSGIT